MLLGSFLVPGSPAFFGLPGAWDGTERSVGAHGCSGVDGMSHNGDGLTESFIDKNYGKRTSS